MAGERGRGRVRGFLLLGGRLADVAGRAKLYRIGLVVFVAASVSGGLAAAPGLLIASRVVQGVGAALLAPAGLSLLVTSWPDEKAGPGLGRLRGRGVGRLCCRRRARRGSGRGDVAPGVLRQRPDRGGVACLLEFVAPPAPTGRPAGTKRMSLAGPAATVTAGVAVRSCRP